MIVTNSGGLITAYVDIYAGNTYMYRAAQAVIELKNDEITLEFPYGQVAIYDYFCYNRNNLKNQRTDYNRFYDAGIEFYNPSEIVFIGVFGGRRCNIY